MMFTKEQYMPLVNKGYITRRVHPEDNNIVILNYTDLCVYDRAWDKITMACRGLILNELTGKVLARPFKKFFNYEENLGNGKVASPNKGTPEITIKHDGSLGISYMFNKKICWASRGSFESDQAKMAQKIWDEKYSHVPIPDFITILVEIIYPENRIVVDYHGLSDLIMIGMIDNDDGYDFEYDAMKIFADTHGLTLTKKIGANLSEILEIAPKLDANEEGFVLRWNDGLAPYRLKVKGDKYMEVHRLIHGLSLKQKVESWANGNIEQFLRMMPEEFRPEIEKVIDQCEMHYKGRKEYLYKQYKMSEKRGGRKRFADWVNEFVDPICRGYMFNLYDGHSNEQVQNKIKQDIFRDYANLIRRNAE